jgi:hypothetical protein
MKQFLLGIFGTLSFDKALEMKETALSIKASGFSVSVAPQSRVLSDMIAFFKSPPNLLEIDDVSSFTKLSVSLSNINIDYHPLFKPLMARISLERLKVKKHLCIIYFG